MRFLTQFYSISISCLFSFYSLYISFLFSFYSVSIAFLLRFQLILNSVPAILFLQPSVPTSFLLCCCSRYFLLRALMVCLMFSLYESLSLCVCLCMPISLCVCLSV